MIHGHLGGPPRPLKGIWWTPGVVVEGEEVASLGRSTTLHVKSRLIAILCHVCGRITNRDRTIFPACDVLLHVAGDGFDVWSAIASGDVVDDLVAREEEKSVVVLGERVNSGENILQIYIVVGRAGTHAVERVAVRIDVQSKVDAGIGQSSHASVVVGGIVNCVHADSVYAELLELGDIASASLNVGDRINGVRGTAYIWSDSERGILSCWKPTWLIVHAADVKPSAARKESITFDCYLRCIACN